MPFSCEMLADIEEWLARLVRRMVRAFRAAEHRHPRTRRDRALVAVVREERERGVLAMPGGQQAHREPDRRGGQDSIRPDDLRTFAGRSVPRGL